MTKKTNPRIKLLFTASISLIVALLLFVLLLKNSSLASNEVRNALNLCSTMLIPSLFPLTVASEIMTNSGAAYKLTRGLGAPFAKILGVSKNATAPYFLGLFGGYTSSCKSAVLLYREGKISKRDCESIIAISNMPSLAFMTGFIGIGIFEISTVGWILWIITVLSTLVLGVINRLFFRKNAEFYMGESVKTIQKKSLPKIIVDAISNSAFAMLIVCACVVFFSVLIAVFKQYLCEISFPENAKQILLGLLEITSGISGSTVIKNISSRALACAFLVGWSGLCVHFQVIALCEDSDISFKKYFIFKALQGVICFLIALIVFRFKF